MRIPASAHVRLCVCLVECGALQCVLAWLFDYVCVYGVVVCLLMFVIGCLCV